MDMHDVLAVQNLEKLQDARDNETDPVVDILGVVALVMVACILVWDLCF